MHIYFDPVINLDIKILQHHFFAYIKASNNFFVPPPYFFANYPSNVYNQLSWTFNIPCVEIAFWTFKEKKT